MARDITWRRDRDHGNGFSAPSNDVARALGRGDLPAVWDDSTAAREFLPAVRGEARLKDFLRESMTSEAHHHLEYEFPPPQLGAPVAVSIARVLALGYVAVCVFGLVLMGVIMALQV